MINRHVKHDEIGLDDLRATLGANRMRVIPNSYAEVARAINQGRPLMAVSRSNPVVRAINELAESLLPKADRGQRGLLGRLWKHSGL